jgi:hypothetical protein
MENDGISFERDIYLPMRILCSDFELNVCINTLCQEDNENNENVTDVTCRIRAIHGICAVSTNVAQTDHVLRDKEFIELG